MTSIEFVSFMKGFLLGTGKNGLTQEQVEELLKLADEVNDYNWFVHTLPSSPCEYINPDAPPSYPEITTWEFTDNTYKTTSP